MSRAKVNTNLGLVQYFMELPKAIHNSLLQLINTKINNLSSQKYWAAVIVNNEK